MAKSPVIRGRALGLTIDGVDHYCDIRSAILDNEEGDTDAVTFCDPEGGRQFFFTLTGNQSTATASFWRMIWEHSGELVPFVFAPHGNATASEDEPHFTGTLTIGPKPQLGGQAGRTNTYSFETRFDVEGEPELVTTGSTLPERTAAAGAMAASATTSGAKATTSKTTSKAS